jgi:hypothetical protein
VGSGVRPLLLDYQCKRTRVAGHVDHDVLHPPFLKDFDRIMNVLLETSVIALEKANKQLTWPEVNGPLYAELDSPGAHAPHQSYFWAKCGIRGRQYFA